MPATRGQRARAALGGMVRAGLGLSVAVLAWPAEEDVRRHMTAVGQPHLLVLDEGVEPPADLAPTEDWVRVPVDPADIEARATALLARAPASAPAAPVLDDDGLLHVGDAWVVIPPNQVVVMALLLANLGRVVRKEAVAAACAEAGASAHPASVRTLLSRLGARVRPLGLELVTIRQRGVLLRQAPASGWA